MLNEMEMRRLVDMQHRSYLLLRWMAQAVSKGMIRFETAHDYSTLPEAAEHWIRGHFQNIPPSARPDLDDLSEFCAIFSTYLTNSFDFVANPGKQLYSPDAHCFCPMCSWLIEAPHLKTKKVRPSHKQRAHRMKADALLTIAAENRLDTTQTDIDKWLDNPEISEDASLVAYGHDLSRRAKGIASGPAILALWRGFAWTPSGSPKHNFRLRAETIVEAERRLPTAMREIETRKPNGIEP